MRDLSEKHSIEAWTAKMKSLGEAETWIGFAIDAIHDDTQHGSEDEAVSGCTYEEIMGALLYGRWCLQQLKRGHRDR